MHVVCHLLLHEECGVEVLDEALPETDGLALVHIVPALHVDGALAETVLHGGEVGLVACLHAFVLHAEVVDGLHG